ncbi:OmpA family protein [Arenibacterium sp. CAU 1754]
MKSLLKSTTALLLATSMSLPHTAFAADEGTSGPTDEQIKKLNLDPSLSQGNGDASAETGAQAESGAADGTAKKTKEQIQAERKAAREAENQAIKDARKAERAAENAAERERRKAEAQAKRAAKLAEQANAAAAAADSDGAADAQVSTETVTADDVRSSTEEYATPATQTTAPAVRPKKDDGISDLGKVALLGLGALAVGQLLKNGDKVVSNSGDRVVVEGEDGFRVLKNDDVLLRQAGSQVRTETFSDGSTRSFVTREDGSQVITIRSADGRVLRRTRLLADGREVLLFDDTQVEQAVSVNDLPRFTDANAVYGQEVSDQDLELALMATRDTGVERRFSLAQIRSIDAVRHLVPEVPVRNINFETGSSVIRSAEARQLARLGSALRGAIEKHPDEVFLIEGHTDAVGGAAYNLALSDRRAETVALALSEYFNVPPENLVVQGYGEADLKIEVETAERANRRVTVRRITPLLQ